MTLYFCYDVVAKKVFDVFMADNDAVAIQRNLPQLARFRRLQDFDIYAVAEIDVNSIDPSQIMWTDARLVDKNCYKFSEIEMDHISKTDAIRQIELYRKSQELQIKTMQAELEKINSQMK